MNMPASMRPLADGHFVSVLNRRPAVIGAYEFDFIRHREAFAAFARGNPGSAVLLQLGYEHESPELADPLAEALARFRAEAPGARAVVLCNSTGECAALEKRGAETRWIQQNCFLDERRYRPLGGRERPYDAAYVSRLTPCKRHELMPPELAPKLLLLGCTTKVYDSERDYADMVFSRYAGARIVGVFRGAELSVWLSLAKCGLILSAREGASFCSSEYLLCGLPVVDTPALGGRDALYPGEFVASVGSTPEAVAEGIARWAALRPDPWKVRAAWLEKAAPHRERYRALMKELTGRACGRPPHKLGLRTPRPGLAATLAIQAYLLAKELKR